MTFPTIGPTEAREYIRQARATPNDISRQIKEHANKMKTSNVRRTKKEMIRDCNEVLQLLQQGLVIKEIARQLNWEYRHVMRIVRHLQWHTMWLSTMERAQIAQQRKAFA